MKFSFKAFGLHTENEIALVENLCMSHGWQYESYETGVEIYADLTSEQVVEAITELSPISKGVTKEYYYCGESVTQKYLVEVERHHFDDIVIIHIYDLKTLKHVATSFLYSVDSSVSELLLDANNIQVANADIQELSANIFESLFTIRNTSNQVK